MAGAAGSEHQGSPPHDAAEDREVLAMTRAIARGDPDAFARFYEVWFDRAYKLVRGATRRDEAFCLDVVQDAMLRVVRSLRPTRGRQELSRWFARVVYTTALDHLRRETRRNRHEKNIAATARRSRDDAGLLEVVELEEQQRWLEERLAELQPTDKALLRLRFFDAKTLREAGAAVGLSSHAARGRIERTLRRLRAAARSIFGGVV